MISEETRAKFKLNRLGKHHTEETKMKMRIARARQIPPMLGKRFTDEHKHKLGLSKFKEGNGMWKGDKVGYSGLHTWIRSHLSKPESCANCNEKKKLHAANMTGIYNREFKNWAYLCVRCHKQYDMGKLVIQN